MKHSLIAATLCSSIFCAASFAEENSDESTLTNDVHEYKASAELGFLYKTGNTKSGDIKAGVEFEHKFQRWHSVLRTNLLYKKTENEVTDANGNTTDEFETSDQKWGLATQTNYLIGDKAPESSEKADNYIYGSLWYEDDRFSSFDNQSSISLGWGKSWHKSEKSKFYGDIGPGFKRDVLKATDTEESQTNDTFIMQAQGIYEYQINEHVEFKQFLSAKYALESGQNSTYKSISSISTKLIDTLQLKFSFIVDHNTEVDKDKENTDTQTAITLVYSF